MILFLKFNFLYLDHSIYNVLNKKYLFSKYIRFIELDFLLYLKLLEISGNGFVFSRE